MSTLIADQELSVWRLTKLQAFVVTMVIAGAIWLILQASFLQVSKLVWPTGLLVTDLGRAAPYLATIFSLSYILLQGGIIRENYVGLQTFLGKQTGVTWNEGIYFAPTIPLASFVLGLFGMKLPLGWRISAEVSIRKRTVEAHVYQMSNQGYRLHLVATSMLAVKNAFKLHRNGEEETLKQLAAEYSKYVGLKTKDMTFEALQYTRPHFSTSFNDENSPDETFGLEFETDAITNVVLVDDQTQLFMDSKFASGLRKEEFSTRASELKSLRQYLGALGKNISDDQLVAIYSAFAGKDFKRGTFGYSFNLK